MKSLNDCLKALMTDANLPDGQLARSVKMASTLIRQHIVEIELAHDCGLESHEVLDVVNMFVRSGKEITLKNFNNRRYEFRKLVPNLEAEKTRLLKEMKSVTALVERITPTNNTVAEAKLNDTKLATAIPVSTQTELAESESIVNKSNKVTNPTELRNLRRNSDPDFR